MSQGHQGHGHRQRLRDRFLKGGHLAIADYELLEMILFSAKPRGDTKSLAKDLLKHFKSFSKVIHGDPREIKSIPGAGDSTVAALKIIQAATARLLQERVLETPIISSWSQLIEYCQVTMGHLKVEQFRLLFLDRENRLMADEVQQTGTVDQTSVYPREVLKRALELGASALILVHNHPSGNPTPSRADIQITVEIQKACAPLGIHIHDHLIITAQETLSLKSKGFF
jgi:DNA repair protein RadC